MRYFRIEFFSIALVTCATSYSQTGSFNLGGRNAGMAGASITLGDAYSLFNNVGGLGRVENHEGFATYQNRYGIKEFQVVGAGAVYSSNIGTTGLGFYKFGDDRYSEQRLHVAFGNQFQMVSLGIGVDLLQYNVATVGSSQSLAIQFGGIAEITKALRIGAHIFNLNQAELSKETGEKIPTVMKAGISFLPSEEMMINAEIEKDLDFNEVFKAGLEYQIIQNVYLRTGFSTEPFLGAFGAGFHPKNLKFDYAFSNDSRLGSIHEVSFGYSFSK